MSAFSNQLQRSIEEDGLTQQAIVEKTNREISQGSLSRYCNSENRPPVDQLEKLMGVFSEKQRVLLLLAYLYDDIPAAYRNLVSISARTGRVAEDAPVYRSHMPEKLRTAYDGLGAKAIEQQDVADSLIATWRILGSR